MIDRTASASRPPNSEIDRDHDHDPPRVAAKPKPRDAFENAVVSVIGDRRADESLRMFAAHSGASASAAPPNRRDDVLYLGMNTDKTALGRPQADAEASALVGMTKGHAERIACPPTTIVENAGAKFDTHTPEGCNAFAKSLGLGPAQTAVVAKALTDNHEGKGRTELALLAKSWSEAEHGATLPGRLVLSGHCTGIGGIYDNGGSDEKLNLDSLRAIARAMPNASAQIEDVMISACHSGLEKDTKAWAETFPNLKSLWAYGGAKDERSPSGQGALEHIRVWEQATRGDHVPLAKDQATPGTQDAAMAARIHTLPVHDHISTWTAIGGYRNAM
jgi:hypothetical protein